MLRRASVVSGKSLLSSHVKILRRGTRTIHTPRLTLVAPRAATMNTMKRASRGLLLTAFGLSYFKPGVSLCDTAEGAAPDADAPDDAKSTDSYVDWIIDNCGAALGQITMGAALGFCAGYALKQVGKAAAFGIGVFFVSLQGLAFCGYIEIKWSKAFADGLKAIDTDGDGKITSKDLRVYAKKALHILMYQLPSGGGFISGLLYGMRF